MNYTCMIGTGGIGSGLFFEIKGNHDLGRNESREARLLDRQDFCKLHIIVHYVSIFLGGKKGFTVVPVGKVGSDDIGKKLLDMMQEAGMDTSYVSIERGINTLFSVCFQYPDGTGGNLTTDNSASSFVSEKYIYNIENVFNKHKHKGIALVVPEVPMPARKALLKLGRKYDFFNAASFRSGDVEEALRDNYLELIDLISTNIDEAEAFAGIKYEPENEEDFFSKCTKIFTSINPEIRISITMGHRGSYGYERGIWQRRSVIKTAIKNTAGAGDAYLAGLLISHAGGIPFLSKDVDKKVINSGIDFASLLASFSTTSEDTIHLQADREKLISFAHSLGLTFSKPIREQIG